MVAVVPLLDVVCKPFLDGLPTVHRSFGCHKNRVLREERGQGGGIVVVVRFLKLLTNRINLSAICGSTVSFCWAKVDKAKLIANPTRAPSKRIFIVSSGRGMVYRLPTRCAISLSRR